MGRIGLFNVRAAPMIPSLVLRSKVFSVTSSSLMGPVTACGAMLPGMRATAAGD
jgi:hypothetical protein